MAIENLEYDRDCLGSEAPSRTQITDKINEIIDYINSKEEYTTPLCKQCGRFHRVGEPYDTIPMDDEQEPNKVELVPLDVEEILDCMTNAHLTKDAVRAILSKYGVPTQKKFAQGIVGERLVKRGRVSHENDGKEKYGVDMLYSFLTERGLLEE